MQNSYFWFRSTSLYGSQTSPVDLWMQNCVLRSKMTLVNWFQPSSVVLCVQNSDFTIRITSLYGSQHSSVVFTHKTATFGSEKQVSICPRPHLWFFASKPMWLASELLVSKDPGPHLWLFAFKRTTLAPEMQVSIGPRLLLFLGNTKQRNQYQNYYSLMVPALICAFCMQTAWLEPELVVSMGPRPNQSLCACQTTWWATE